MSLKDDIRKTGKFPPIELRIKPIWATGAPLFPALKLTSFTEYAFDSSVITPCDSFSFAWAAPSDKHIWSDYFREGDICQLYGGSGANQTQIATGLIDTADVQVDAESGEQISITGRDLMGQLEDQDAVNLDSSMLYGNQMTPTQVFETLKQNTRIPRVRFQDAPKKGYLFATEPHESKLAALQRYLEPLNCIAWCDPDGTMVIGRPDMAQDVPRGTFVLDHINRQSNCLGMKATFAAATIPNVVIPVWAGQEQVQARVGKQQRLENAAEGPSRLFQNGHRLSKCVVVSTPEGSSPQELSSVNLFRVARAGDGELFKAVAKREIARANVKEIVVQVTVPGHFDKDGRPYKTDSVYRIVYPKAMRSPLNMYCFQVQYTYKPEEGQRTRLHFCKLGTIVSDVRAR